MFASTGKFLAALAATAVVMVPLTACSSDSSEENNNSSVSSNDLPLLQIPDSNGQYSAEQDQQWQEVTGNDRSASNSGLPDSLISSAVPKDFDVPDDIAPGTYVFKPYADRGGVFYMGAGFGKMPDVQYIDVRTLVTLPAEGMLVIERIEVFEPTAEQMSSLPHVDLSSQ